MESLEEVIAETVQALNQFASKNAGPEGPIDGWDKVFLRDRLFHLMEQITDPEGWVVEMVEMMSIVEHHLTKKNITMDYILSVVEPDQLALMSEIIDAVDRSPEWGR